MAKLAYYPPNIKEKALAINKPENAAKNKTHISTEDNTMLKAHVAFHTILELRHKRNRSPIITIKPPISIKYNDLLLDNRIYSFSEKQDIITAATKRALNNDRKS